MIELFVEHAGPKVIGAVSSYAAGELENVERLVHSVKSSAGNLGAVELGSLAAQIERLAAEKNGPAAGMLLSRLEQAFSRAKARLEQEKREIAG